MSRAERRRESSDDDAAANSRDDEASVDILGPWVRPDEKKRTQPARIPIDLARHSPLSAQPVWPPSRRRVGAVAASPGSHTADGSVDKQALSITRPVQSDRFHAPTLEERRSPAMDHGVEDCHRQAQGGSDARVVLEWLDTLSLCPPAGCWFRGCTDLPCQDVTANVVLTSDDSNDNVKRMWAMKLHESSHLVDGLCDVKPVTKRTIAALWVWEDGVLAKAPMAFMRQNEGINMLEEDQVRSWFSKLVCGRLAYRKVPRLLFILEVVIVGFDFWRKQGRSA
ncbi:hypothetical protein LY76DRAFT_203298 [Colletotrichum caudatum]|nr:hypothetical protein LY76DRAFT_203298 [Colletotrichum caudatum]